MRVPLLAGSRLVLVNVPDDTPLHGPPPPLDPIADVAAAVGEALRFPLAGPPLGELATPGGRATIVVEHPSLPLPGAPRDPRQDALAATIDELERAGVRPARQTLLVAGGLERRAGRRELERLLRPERARDFRGAVLVHDCADPALRPLATAAETALAAHPALLDTDLVVVVTAAETLAAGGPAALLAAGAAEALRAAAEGPSLLEPAGSPAWALATACETALAAAVPLIGVSLVLDHPRLEGRLRDYPWSRAARDAVASSPFRHVLASSPSSVRRRLLQATPRTLSAVAVLGGVPSVAHMEALLRGIALRRTPLARPLDAVVVPVPWKPAHQPREPVNPLSATAIALGLGLRLWRDAPPLAEGGTVVLLHGFGRTFGHGPQAPYRQLFAALRDDASPEAVDAAERVAGADAGALDAYRAGRAPHPLLPYADWAGCRPALERAGRVIVGACRDAGAARALGFVPSHSATAAFEMAVGVAGGDAHVGLLLAPPYAPLLVGGR